MPADAMRDLRTIPGIGEILETAIVLETGPIDLFASAGDHASYHRMVVSVRLSKQAQRPRQCEVRNRRLCWAFIEAAKLPSGIADHGLY